MMLSRPALAAVVAVAGFVACFAAPARADVLVQWSFTGGSFAADPLASDVAEVVQASELLSSMDRWEDKVDGNDCILLYRSPTVFAGDWFGFSLTIAEHHQLSLTDFKFNAVQSHPVSGRMTVLSVQRQGEAPATIGEAQILSNAAATLSEREYSIAPAGESPLVLGPGVYDFKFAQSAAGGHFFYVDNVRVFGTYEALPMPEPSTAVLSLAALAAASLIRGSRGR